MDGGAIKGISGGKWSRIAYPKKALCQPKCERVKNEVAVILGKGTGGNGQFKGGVKGCTKFGI